MKVNFYHRIQCVRYRPRLFIILCLPCHSQQIPAFRLSYSLSFHCTLTLPCGVSLSNHPTYLLNSIKQSPLRRTMTPTLLAIAQTTSRIWRTNVMTSGLRQSSGPLADRFVLTANEWSSLPIVKCTHPDDRLLPPAEKIEEMRKVLVALGLKGSPVGSSFKIQVRSLNNFLVYCVLSYQS